MKISFFKNGYIALNEDHTYIKPITKDGITEPAKGHPDCLYCKSIDFDPSKQMIDFDPSTEEIAITDIPENKHSRIYQSIISSESIDGFDLEGELFSDFEIGEIIMARVFGGNPHAQMAFIAKMQAMSLSGNMNPELMQKAQEIEIKINAVRSLFNLGNL